MRVLRNIFIITGMVTGIFNGSVAGQDDATENGLQIIHDLEYKKQLPGQSPALNLDIYRYSRVTKKKQPAILFVHGGGFWEGDKQSPLYVKMATAFAKKGYISISVNYTLKKEEAPYSTLVLKHDISDVLAALRWIQENRERLGIDISKLIICGDSAGGGIVINLSYDPAYSKYFAGCIDLWGGLPGDRGWNAPLFPDSFTGQEPPTCIIHGTVDRIVPFQTGEQLNQGLRTAGVYHELHSLKNADHYPVQLADQFIPLMTAFADKVIQTPNPCREVNPFIGTANSGNTNPGAVMPWGMVSLSPFNSYDSASGHGGASPYVYGNSRIYGFTHLNMSGVGCADMGILCLMPISGKLDAGKTHPSAYSSEQASPGYYSVNLDRYHIKAELSTTLRSGISCYTFPAGESHILLDLGLGLTAKKGGEIKRVSETEAEGFKNIGDICGLNTIQTVYFVARVSRKPLKAGLWSDGRIYPKFRSELAGNRIGAFFSYRTKAGEKIYIKTGISYVSIENARKNLEAEQPAFDFDSTRRSAEASWNRALAKIKIEGGTADDRIKFYTALYHTLIHPNIFSDVNGEYKMFEGNKIGRSGPVARYTVFSLWDTYRCLHPFLSLVYPEKQSGMVRSLLGMALESGWLPKWEYAGIESGAMTGDPSLIVIADTWVRGIRDFNIRQAYDAMKRNAETPEKDNPLRPGMDNWLHYGYIPGDAPNVLHPFEHSVSSAEDYENMRERRIVWGSVSTALEYCMADWSLAQIAKYLGKETEYQQFRKRADSYRNNFDPRSGFMRSRTENGKWVEPFEPASLRNNAFTEGSSWNYSFMVPFDIPGLIRLMGGEEKFTKKLDSCFNGGHFDMTNEPDFVYPYLYDHIAGSEWKTQRQVRKLIAGSFKNTPDGLPGNDDCGTLSAWLVFSMMGIYPACPGTTQYLLSAPVFKKISIELDPVYYPGKTFVIESESPDEKNEFIRSIRLNGRPYKKFSIDHGDIIRGGHLTFYLKNQP